MKKINDLVDEVLLINLPSATQRLEKVTKELSRNEITFRKITPVPASNFDVEINENFGWNNNAKSLHETTKLIIKEAIKKKRNQILIFEDDAFLDDEGIKNFIRDFELFNEKFKYWDFIHLNWDNGQKFSLYSPFNFRATLDGVLRCQAYLINDIVFETYLNNLEKLDLPIDWIVKRIQAGRKRSWVYEPKIVTQKKGEYSTLREKDVDY